jgi:hypothetical protein
VNWPIGGAYLSLTLDSVRYYEGEAPFCEFNPRDFDGETECLDESPARPIAPELGGVN